MRIEVIVAKTITPFSSVAFVPEVFSDFDSAVEAKSDVRTALGGVPQVG
jgi:hypothetical protein